MSGNWNTLLDVAKAEVQHAIQDLPADLRPHAFGLAVTYESLPSEELLADGWEDDLLGMYVGDPVGAPEMSAIPRQVRLFLENLWEASEGDWDRYREEVRITFLHEFGHYLGWDEEELEARGLL